jgi:PKD domain
MLIAALAALGALGAPSAAKDAQKEAQSVQFTASPTSGPAPLTVKFCASAGISIVFGDGTSSGMGSAQDGNCSAGLSWYTSHTYTAPGTYRLRGFPCPSSMFHTECGQAAAQANGVIITVTRP